MLRFFLKKLFKVSRNCVFYIIILFYILFVVVLYKYYKDTHNYPVVVWWTSSFPGYERKISKCSSNLNCEFVNITNKKIISEAKGFLFYGSQFDPYQLPLPRRPNEVLWGLLHEESPRNVPILSHEKALQLFNYSSTISRFSNLPLTLQYLNNIDEITTKQYYIDTKSKNKLLKNLSPVLYMQSDCDTSSYRDEYVKEMMKYVSIDSYGNCLNNKQLPEKYKNDYLNNLDSDEFLGFVNRYKFTISFENGICDDYITEKLWRPLKVGSVPIYLGSPTVKDWLPTEWSVIQVEDFKSPKHLAQYILYLNAHDDEYERYLEHKLSKNKLNDKLVNEMNLKKYTFDDDLSKESFPEAFECFFCLKVHESIQQNTKSVVNQSHYNCKKPVPPWDGIKSSWWTEMWDAAKKEAFLLNKFLIKDNKSNFTKEEFENELLSL